MSFLKKLFGKNEPQAIPIESVDDELQYLKDTLAQSLSKSFLLQRIKPQDIELKEQSADELVFQGQYGFFLTKLNEDAEIYDCVYTELSGESHHLVKGDQHNYGKLTFKETKKGPGD